MEKVFLFNINEVHWSIFSGMAKERDYTFNRKG
jgi:hypothetical protein